MDRHTSPRPCYLCPQSADKSEALLFMSTISRRVRGPVIYVHNQQTGKSKVLNAEKVRIVDLNQNWDTCNPRPVRKQARPPNHAVQGQTHPVTLIPLIPTSRIITIWDNVAMLHNAVQRQTPPIWMTQRVMTSRLVIVWATTRTEAVLWDNLRQKTWDPHVKELVPTRTADSRPVSRWTRGGPWN